MDVDVEGKSWFSMDWPEPEEPICCFFKEINSGGDIGCAGASGGELPKDFRDNVQSITCHGQGQARLYVDGYGMNCGATVAGRLDELSCLFVDNEQQDYSKKAKYAWISKA